MIALPWPPKELNPNARTHWAAKARITKSTRTAAAWLTKASGEKAGEGRIDLHVTFCPPDKRKRDMDNMLSSAKSLLDGVADGLGCNDNQFRMTLEVGPVIAGGLVEVRVLQMLPQVRDVTCGIETLTAGGESANLPQISLKCS